MILRSCCKQSEGIQRCRLGISSSAEIPFQGVELVLETVDSFSLQLLRDRDLREKAVVSLVSHEEGGDDCHRNGEKTDPILGGE